MKSPKSEEHHLMKCQKCDNQAIFHITELMDGEPVVLHLCEQHANEYLHKTPPAEDGESETNESMESPKKKTGITEEESMKNSPLHQTTEELKELDFQVCPVCGLDFQEFRKSGRFGCPNDYKYFGPHIEQLLLGIHGYTEHIGKHPLHNTNSEGHLILLRLRREMEEAVAIEDYERASRLRDKIRSLEKENNR